MAEPFRAAPPVSLAPSLTALKGVKSVFFQGPPFQGRPTKAFAYYGVPKREKGPVPGIVLIHGGAGTAYAEWVKLWNKRGYAAIAFDHFGSLPIREGDGWKRNPDGGPPDQGDCSGVELPLTEQWIYHAVANTLLATSLLGSLPGVDPGYIGLTGISRGAMVACIVAGLDDRLRFVAPVYGCGFVSCESEDGSQWVGRNQSSETLAKWRALWDPAHYLPDAKAPMLWVTGTNDFAYTPHSWQLSYRTAPGTRFLSQRLNMPHSQKQGAAPEEIVAFADSVVRGTPSLIRITASGRQGTHAWAEYEGETPVKASALVFTRQGGRWQDRLWEAEPATTDIEKRRVSAEVPPDAQAWFFQLTDERGLMVSSPHRPECALSRSS